MSDRQAGGEHAHRAVIPENFSYKRFSFFIFKKMKLLSVREDDTNKKKKKKKKTFSFHREKEASTHAW
jgi:hypothetical protein